MHRSYAIQDGCHNCGECPLGANGYDGDRYFCNSDDSRPKRKDYDGKGSMVQFMGAVSRWEWEPGREVQPAGKCDEWRGKP